jgi:5-methylcytosine-specific restriction endonuclease McrA
MTRIDVSSSDGLSRSSDSARSTRLDPSSRPGHPGRSLSGLSNGELLSRVKDLAARERAVTLEILLHLIEVERRRLHVGLGCASMFDYCTRHLGYPSSSAARRIQTARCLRDYPEVYRLLEKNEVNLSTVSLVSSILTQENHQDILDRIRNRSQKEVEAVVADYRPPVSLRDRARPVWVAVPASSTADGSLRSSPADAGPETPVADRMCAQTAGSGGGTLGALFARAPERAKDSAASVTDSTEAGGTAPTQRTSGCDSSRCGSGKRPNTAADSVGGRPQFERKLQVQFVASERFMKKLERARALLSNRNGRLSYETVLEAALDEFLKDRDPEERNKRREERKQKAETPNKSKHSAAKRTVETAASRRIPAAVRDAVFTRDKGRCTYVGSAGNRCDAARHLQIDHIVPYARGGTNTLGNLRLLCERHNKLEAERVLGESKLRRFRRRE